MPSTEIRNIYPGECLFLNDTQVLRIQTFGASSTLNSEDVNELGNFEIVEIVDNVPAVAITLDTYDYGSIDTACLLAGKNPAETRYVRAADFEKASVDIYAPIIKGEDYGKVRSDNPDIYRTMYIDNAFVNSLTLTYNTTAIGTENYALESDNKTWFNNDGASVIHAMAGVASANTNRRYRLDGTALAGGEVRFVLDSGYTPDDDTAATQLNDGTYVLKTDLNLEKIIEVVEADGDPVLSGGEPVQLKYKGTVANGANTDPGAGYFYIEEAGSKLRKGTSTYAGISVIVSSADQTAYDTKYLSMRYIAPKGGAYFAPDSSEISGLRLGQIQIYLAPTVLDSGDASKKRIDIANTDIFWRQLSSTITVTLTREPLLELGHFRPYARPLTFPIPVTVASEATDSDTLMFARLCGKSEADFANEAEVSIDDLLKDLNLVVKLYRYSDIERKKIASAIMNANSLSAIAGYSTTDATFDESASDLPAYGGSGTDYTAQIDGVDYYVHDLAPLKVVAVKKLIPTGENQNLAVGSNATQTFDFRADNFTMGIGAANALCIGYDGANTASGEEIAQDANAANWQAFKYGGDDAHI